MIINKNYKLRFKFENDGPLKILNIENTENDFYKAKIFCSDVNSPFAIKKIGLIEIITKANSNDFELNLFTQNLNFDRSKIQNVQLNNRLLEKRICNLEKHEIIISLAFQEDVLLELERLDIYKELKILLDTLYNGIF